MFAVAMTLLGLVSNLPFLTGPAVGIVGVLVSHALRRRRLGWGAEISLLPALGALVTLVFASPPEISAGLFAGLSSLAFLLWVADDPRREAGGGRRAVQILGLSSLGFGVIWGVSLVVSPGPQDIGVAGALAAGALLLVVPVLLLSGTRRAAETP